MVRPSRILGSIVSLAALVAIWMLFAPPQVGGSLRMLAIHGNSMEPRLTAGDLAFVREGTYEVGDVVAYRGELVDSVLLHRIIAIEDGRFTLQGDNNDFVDPDRPGMERILGELAFRIPNGASVLRIIASPAVVSISAGLLFLLFIVRRRRDADDRRGAFTMTPSLHSRMLNVGAAPAARAAALALLIFACAATGVGAAAAFAPAAPAASTPYTHQGAFSYVADAPTSVYADGLAQTGDAVFVDVSPVVRLAFAYTLTTQAPNAIDGRIALRLAVSDAAGWSRAMTLRGETPFTGTSASIAAPLNLRKLRGFLQRVQAETGVARSTYQVIVQPAVEVTGTMDGVEVKTAFTPSLTLEYDGLVLRYVAPLDAASDPLAPSIDASIVGASAATGEPTIRLLGRTLPAHPLAAGLGAAALASAIAAWILLRAAKRYAEMDVAGRIRTRFADRIVMLERLPERQVVFVKSEDGFNRLAASSDEPILEHEDRFGVSWLMRDGETMYAFRIDAKHGPIMLTQDARNIPAVY